MYEYIKGELVEATPANAVVDCGGVGYYIHISVNTYSKIAPPESGYALYSPDRAGRCSLLWFFF
ncbi:MAG: OB-fold domain-containing protein [Butyricimonas faecihominis]